MAGITQLPPGLQIPRADGFGNWTLVPIDSKPFQVLDGGVGILGLQRWDRDLRSARS